MEIMDYDAINVDEEVAKVDLAMEQGNFRRATKRESMEIRLAALSAIVHKMQAEVAADKEIANA
jgi:hypothetical protein